MQPRRCVAGVVRRHERDTGQRVGISSAEAHRIKEFQRELRRANEILKLASALFAQAELDRRFKSSGRLSTSIAMPMASICKRCRPPRRGTGAMWPGGVRKSKISTTATTLPMTASRR